MRRTVCSGCGLTVTTGEEERSDIRRVQVTVYPTDLREMSQRLDADHYDEDLCPTCRGQMLAAYFGVPAHGGLELPSFLPPTPLEAVR